MGLPSGYTQLEWIKSTGTQWINTEAKPSNPKIEIVIEEFTASDTSTAYVAGIYNSNYFALGFSSSKAICGRHGTGSLQTGTVTLVPGSTITITNNNITQDGTTALTFTQTGYTASTSPMGVFAAYSSTTGTYNPNRVASLTISSFKLYDGNSLIRDLVPAKNSSGTIGMYDVANNKFYTNAGSGSFTAGPVVANYITYSTAHGTAPEQKEIDVPYSLVASDLPTLSATGYVFDGWYKESTFVNKAKVDDVILDDITLYAKWLEKITIHYVAKYGTAPADLVVDPPSYTLTSADLPTIKVVGYKAENWYYNDTFTNKANVGDSITSDKTLYAKFEETEIIVDGKTKIEINVKRTNNYDVLHPITDASIVEYKKDGLSSDIQTVLGTTSDNMSNIVATASDIEIRQHGLFIIAKDTVVPTSAWVNDSTYTDYPKRAAISIAGCNVFYVPDVYFDVDDINEGIFAPVSQTGEGVVYIYASSTPSSAITIPTIKLATEASNISSLRVLAAIDVPNKPYKTKFVEGETIDYAGMLVKAYYSNGAVRELDYSEYTITPAFGTVLTQSMNTVVITLTEDGIQKSTSFSIEVGPNIPEIVSWSSGTDAQIVAMIEALDEGRITTAQTGWAVGDERNISLSAFNTYSNSSTSTTSQSAQTAKLVIMGISGKNLTAGGTCNYIVGFKDNVCKSFWGTTSNSYASSLIKTVEQNIYNAIPNTIKSIFKQWNVVTGTYGGSNTTTSQYLASPAEKEVMGTRQYSTSDEGTALSVIPYYSTSTHRAHSNYNTAWWNRSPSATLNNHACDIISASENGSAAVNMEILGVSPIGCI